MSEVKTHTHTDMSIEEKRYTGQEMNAIMDSVGFPKGLSFMQMIKIAYWSLFNIKRLNRFCWNIERGMSLYFAFNDADNNQTFKK